MTAEEYDRVIYGGLEAADLNRPSERVVVLDEIVIDDTIQVRVGGLDDEIVERYAQILGNGGAFADPVDLYADEDGQLWLADGFHRCAALRLVLESDEVPEDLAPLRGRIWRAGGREAALEHAEEANLDHGLYLSTADKRQIYWRRIDRGHAWAEESFRTVGARLGVAHTTVSRWRDDYLQMVQNQGGANAPVAEEYEKPKKASRAYTGVGASNKKRAPTTLQLRQRVLKHLRAAADALAQLKHNEDVATVEAWIDALDQEWQ